MPGTTPAPIRAAGHSRADSTGGPQGWGWTLSVVSRLEKLCQEKGLKMTEQRRVIARVLSDAEDHPDVEQLYRRASKIDPGISLATVYRTVRLFEGCCSFSISSLVNSITWPDCRSIR